MYEDGRKIRGLVPTSSFGRQDQAYNAFLDEMAPHSRPEVQFALAATSDTRFVTFLERLGQPVCKRVPSLAAVAKECGISLQEFNDWWQRSASQAAIAKAKLKSMEIMADMATDALSSLTSCERCDGIGFVGADAGLANDPPPGYRILRTDERRTKDEEGNPTIEEVPVWVRTCPGCDGARKVRKIGDEFSREKTLEAAGLINQKGPGLQLIQNFGGAGMATSISRLNVLDVDAEVVQD